MTVLTYLSMAYAAVLVLALAIVLITILVLLWRVRGALVRVQASLELAAVRTTPLRSRLEVPVSSADAVARDLSRAAASVTRAVELLTGTPIAG
jgi:hypothetical protein